MPEIEQPVFVNRLPPCNHACPAGEDIQRWILHAGSGDYRAAWKSVVENNPFPAIMGRACYHPCESHCNRAEFDQSVNIHAVERFLGDEAIRQGWQFDTPPAATGKHVLVIGAGPSGLSAAYHLRRFGHAVSIFDAGPYAGGMMRFGIPKYRLPREILDVEIARIEAMGVSVQLNTQVDDLQAIVRQNRFDAIFLAVGAHLAKRTYIPARDASRILEALSLLRGIDGDVPTALGKRVLIYGGGNTALDAARTARRLGAAEALIVYRRTRDKMPAHDFEVQEAIDEGVLFKWLATVKEAGEKSFTVEKMRLDESGFPQPTGEFETLEADTLILALGQDVDLGFLQRVDGISIENGVVKVGSNMMTGCPGVFAGGDMVPAERTVTVAVGHGHKAARNIDAYLRGETYQTPAAHELATADRLNPKHYRHIARTVQQTLDPARRESTFDEVIDGLDEDNAVFESRRCLSCGNCFECDNCYKVCPGDAVLKLGAGKGYQFNYDNCDGCGLCAEECPCGAIDI